MNHISDWVTHIENSEDIPYLRRRLFDVNMRLFRANTSYCDLVLDCCKHIASVCTANLKGYKVPHGTSGANCAIPFNIIALHVDRGTPQACAQVMINPHIIAKSEETTITESNCGSIRLDAPIPVYRHNTIYVEWYDTYGEHRFGVFDRHTGAFTIQHEVDHNNGILITDSSRRVPESDLHTHETGKSKNQATVA